MTTPTRVAAHTPGPRDQTPSPAADSCLPEETAAECMNSGPTRRRFVTEFMHSAFMHSARRVVPGLLACAVATAIAILLSRLAPVSSLVISLALGAVLGSVIGAVRGGRPAGATTNEAAPTHWLQRLTATTTDGTRWTATHVLRAGVVLLGLQLSLPEVLALGWHGLTVVVVTVAVTFSATLVLGRLLGVSKSTTVLVATGFSICGAAAISAMQGVRGRQGETARDDAVATALALVTIYGSAAIFVLPWLAGLIGLADQQAGLWIGASVQEVAQVVTAGGAISAAALATATVAKLARVVLLAPLVTGAGLLQARRRRIEPAREARRSVPPVPLFVVGFLLAVLVRSSGILPQSWIAGATLLASVLFTAAMFAMGLGVDVPRLVRTGRRAVVLGALSALVVTGVSLVAVLVLT